MALTDKMRKLEQDMDEALDMLDDLTAEDLAVLETEFDPNDEFFPATERKREEEKDRMYHKRDMVAKLENILVQNTSRGKHAERIEPTKQWKTPIIPEYAKVNKTLNNNSTTISNHKNEKNKKPSEEKIKEEKYNTSLTVEEEDLLHDLSEDDLLEIAALSGTHGLLTQDQAKAFDRGGLDDEEWSSLVPTGRQSQPVRGAEHHLRSKSDAKADLDGPLLLRHLEKDGDELFYIRINNVHLERTLLHSIFNALKTTKKIKHISLAGVGMKDEDCFLLNVAFRENKTLESVNLESNDLTNESLEPLLKILETHPTIREFKCAHQKHGLGNRGEEAMARALDKNNRLLKISYPFTLQSARHLADRCQIRNNEILRQKRAKGEENYCHSKEITKRDNHPQPWIKEYIIENMNK